MKILESQSAVLTNYEVIHHVTQVSMGSKRMGKKGPANYETLRKEVIQYLTTSPSPLSQKPLPYTQDSIRELVRRLHPYDLAKGELIMIFNLRPANVVALNTILEEMSDRFNEDQQSEIVAIIADVLGHFPPPQGTDSAKSGEGNGDVPAENGAS
ncbi:hypothetical protein SODALDRAFT_319952 [Sodiomyces alkalinus F11]|uniref:DNA-directed RNA polymerase III subunit RPC9 n=1 Tax=Sodiomyces alkalinus (strain CBS 110278 / VKM F-3762 / F11) TaxID=1314773 RepID=A0A3N2Q9U0_SODAK|nr:hypothetical protein SODALDRAFT_319952 [Sodiomyces alkalinus F11]ROT43520.1 hypothetical protein SODALDRAFT_319952 [Sodiomyces alkalinus F11]